MLVAVLLRVAFGEWLCRALLLRGTVCVGCFEGLLLKLVVLRDCLCGQLFRRRKGVCCNLWFCMEGTGSDSGCLLPGGKKTLPSAFVLPRHMLSSRSPCSRIILLPQGWLPRRRGLQGAVGRLLEGRRPPRLHGWLVEGGTEAQGMPAIIGLDENGCDQG